MRDNKQVMDNDQGMEDEQEKWMRRALELAREAQDAGEVPVGAVVVRGGELVGEGFNQPLSTHDPSAHAEIMAMRDAGQRLGNYRLSGCDLYVTIEPCVMCTGAMIHARVRQLCFGATEPRSGAIVSHFGLHDRSELNHRMMVRGGVLEVECGTLIRDFFRARRRE